MRQKLPWLKKLMKLSVKMNFYSDEPWRTEVGRVLEGEGGLSYETITSMDRKSHETVCLK